MQNLQTNGGLGGILYLGDLPYVYGFGRQHIMIRWTVQVNGFIVMM